MEQQKPVNILLIEDVAEHAELFALTAEQCSTPVRIEVIDDGQAAKVAFHQIASGDRARPDLVMLDLNMPVVSGHELLALIRDSETICNLPVAITTCSVDQDDVLRVAEMGIASYLAKPIQASQLCAVISRAAKML